ncbi:hypothetical protein HZF08_35415 [Paenibacillus sp. CGMCC 1.16610]|uniref:Uncharacterized protein n=1 Tax=Paenibacillus anseongense TaxID=2682845 RepID=A0ABW9U5I9_9BACL|nr:MULTISPECIES: hypothetical protein [Paenibacillus]MBA2943566.1 hypothetical protein [Paenibacillus sp. CGMCC 1.16610]MVQ33060.1 hypothetical protein [Paenibacillus anseongense]
MNDILIKYNEAIKEEQILIQRINVCKEFVDVILTYISEKADSIHILTAEDIVTAVHTIGQDLDTELLHLRLEKGILDNKIKGQMD